MTDNSAIHYGKLTIRRKNKHLLDNLKYVSRRINIKTDIEKIPNNLKIATDLNIMAHCPNLDLKNLKVHGYISFCNDWIHKIYPSAQAKEYHIECFYNVGKLIFKSIYEIYEAFPHLVPDEFQNKYGFEHITIKDNTRIAPVVLENINPKDMPSIIKAKYVVVYSAEQKVLEVMRGDDYGNELYTKIFDDLPDF